MAESALLHREGGFWSAGEVGGVDGAEGGGVDCCLFLDEFEEGGVEVGRVVLLVVL